MGEKVDSSKVKWLLRRVSARQRVVVTVSVAYAWFFLLAGLYAAFFISSRLLGLFPDWFAPETVLIVPAAALALAIVTTRRTSTIDAARLTDTQTSSKDLFLTFALIDSSLGEYKPLVVKAAEDRSSTVDPRRVVPFRLMKRLEVASPILGTMLAAVLFLPQLDPFGMGEERNRLVERRQKLAESRKATKLRLAILKKQRETGRAVEVQRAMEQLKKTFNKAKPADKKGNLRKLAENQKNLGRLWRKISEKTLADAFRRAGPSQRFGGGDAKKFSQWKNELKKGDASGIRKELDDIGRLLRDLAETSDPIEKERLKEAVRSRLRRLSDFAQNEVNSQALSDALSRALEQLAMLDTGAIPLEALPGLGESLRLVDEEFANLARAVRNLQSLEDALEAAQLAKALNAMGKLDGQSCTQCNGMSDYAAFYKDLLAQAGMGGGAGLGMQGPGTGRGGEAPEDDTLKTDYKSELSKSSLTAGKMLLNWKTRGLSERGHAREDYLQSIRQVKQGASEAILREQVPPGYHQNIKRYFSTVGEDGEDASND